MTLGRTANAIKIKTDGGLRAVNCACCGSSCGCYITMSASAQSALNGATSGTLWGFPSTFVELLDDGNWYMQWDHLGSDDEPGMEFSLYYSHPCLHGGGYYFNNTSTDVIGKIAYFVSSPNVQGSNCIQPNFTTATGTFTINGIGPFTYYYITGDTSYPEQQYGPPPVPNLVIS